jgi:hypothetical protein
MVQDLLNGGLIIRKALTYQLTPWHTTFQKLKQRLFDQPEFAKGNFSGTSKGLIIQINEHQFFFPYDPRSFLPIGHASISPSSSLSANLSIHHQDNLNLTSAKSCSFIGMIALDN